MIFIHFLVKLVRTNNEYLLIIKTDATMIKVIIFDLGGVLINLNFNVFFKRISQVTGLPINELSNHKYSNIVNRFMSGVITGEQLHQELCKLSQINISLKKLKDAWSAVLASQKNDVAKIVTELHHTFQVALLSNTDPWHFEYCRQNFPIVNTFKHVFLSYELHLLKPDPEFYIKVSHSLGVRHEECLFIDDTEVNVKSAGDVGYHVIHFKDAEQLKKELLKRNLNLFSSS